MGREEGTTKYAKSAKMQGRLVYKGESYKQENYLKATGKHLSLWFKLGHYQKPRTRAVPSSSILAYFAHFVVKK
jgi:hypothetical protein